MLSEEQCLLETSLLVVWPRSIPYGTLGDNRDTNRLAVLSRVVGLLSVRKIYSADIAGWDLDAALVLLLSV
jgi:hypothetical protein